MRLTRSRTPSDNSFPTLQFFTLALCRLSEPIAITSIFPYAWRMVIGFHVGHKNDASFYCGILIASFSLAEALSSMIWGSLSDRYGRKPILLLGCVGTCVSLMMVGFSTSFTMALIGRILGGLLNGNMGVIQTMVGELVTKPEHEPKAYAIMPFVWSLGTILGPATGGLLADPANAYPDIFSHNGFFGRHPWALPNVVCTALMVVSIIAGYVLLKETHPDFAKGGDSQIHHRFVEHTPVIAAGAMADHSVDLRRESYGTFNEVDVSNRPAWHMTEDGNLRPPSFSEKSASNEKWLTRRVAMLALALGLFTYHSMCYDHLLPIFFQDERVEEVNLLSLNPVHVPGGLGLSTRQVGVIMSVNGLIALFVQAVIFPFAAEKLGIWKVFVIVTTLHPIAYLIVPYLALLPKRLLFTGIYTTLAVRNLLSILAYPVLLILFKQASGSPAFLGRINGLGASVGAASRTIAPPVAGLLYGWGTEIGFTGLAYWGAALVALVGTAQLYFVSRQKNDTAVVRSLVPGFPGADEESPDYTVLVDEEMEEDNE